jgi:hypothetical protein
MACLRFFALAALFALSPIAAMAEVILPSLAAGSSYQLVFTTWSSRNAFSSSIADYNSFVRSQAALNSDLPSTTWWAVASTGLAAQSNARVYPNIPIYNTAGELVAANGIEFYSSTHLASMAFNQFGTPRVASVWTGISANGNPANYLDAVRPATTYGASARLDQGWAAASESFNNLEERALYGLSEPLVAVPEPSTYVMALWGSTCAAWGLLRRRTAA